MKNEMKRGLALLLCLAMVVGVFVGVPGMTTVADAEDTPTKKESTTTLAAVPNGGFESPLSLSNWTVSNAAQVSVVPGAGLNDGSALYIDDNLNSGSAGQFFATSDKIAVTAGTTYTASAYIKGTAKTRLDLVWLDADGAVLSTSSATETQATDSWQTICNSAIAPEGAEYAIVRPFTGASVTGQVYYDNVAFAMNLVPKDRRSNVKGWKATNTWSSTDAQYKGMTATYTTGTDTTFIDNPSTSTGNSYSWIDFSLTAGTTYVAKYTISNSSTSGTDQGYLALCTGSTELAKATHNGDGEYSFLYTPTDDGTYRFYYYALSTYDGSYNISNISLTVNDNIVPKDRRSNVKGWKATNTWSSTDAQYKGMTATYTTGTDTTFIDNPSTSTGNSYSWIDFSLTAGTTYVAKYTISNSSTSGTDQGYLALCTGSTELAKATHNGDGEYSFEYTPTDDGTYRFYYYALSTYDGSYNISNISLMSKTDVTVHNSGFESYTIPNWSFTNNDNTSWSTCTGNGSSTGITLTDTNDLNVNANMIMTSDFIKFDAKYARQIPVVTVNAVNANSEVALTGFEIKISYYDKDKQTVDATDETWTGGWNTSWTAPASGDKSGSVKTDWTNIPAGFNSRMYIPYGAEYLKIQILTGGTGKTAAVSIDNVTLQVKCGHINGNIADTEESQSALVSHAAVAADYFKAGNDEYHECSVCGVKYADANAYELFSGNLNIPKYEVRKNVRMGEYMAIRFGLDTEKLNALSIAPAAVTADIEFNGVTETVSKLEQSTKDGEDIYYVEFSNISAKEMIDVATVKFYHDGQLVATAEASIRDYAEDVIKNSVDQEWKTCCIDMLNYGAAAQTKFSYKTDDLANKNLNGQTSDTSPNLDNIQVVPENNNVFVASNIRFRNNLSMLFAVKADSGAKRGVITFTNHNEEAKDVEATVVSGSVTINETEAVYFEFSGMVVADLNCDITIRIYDSNGELLVEVTDSMAAYVNRIKEKSNDSNMIALADAFAKFSTSAHTYLH